MNRRENRDGLTLIELLIGTSGGTILAVTVGTMLFISYSAWTRNTQAVDLHRNATLAMQVMDRSLRQASAAGVDLSRPDRIVVSNQETSTFCSFYQQGSNLVYNPSMNNGGTPFLLIEGGVSPLGFVHSNIANGVGIRLKLQQGMENLEMNGSICFRN